MKLIRKIFLLLLIAVVLSLIASGIGFYMYRSKPSWYKPRKLTEQQKTAAHQQANQNFLDLVSWAASIEARRVKLRNNPTTALAPIEPKILTFDEDQLNSFINSYPRPDDSLGNMVSPYLGDVRLVLVDEQIILAGDTKEFGTLSSAHFEPSVDPDGKFIFRLAGISAGRLPVPQAMLADNINKVKSRLNQTITSARDQAEIDPSGLANGAVPEVAMSKLFINALDDQASDPVLFLPCYLGDWRHFVPVKVDAVKVVEGSITFTLSPMTPEQETALLEKVRTTSVPSN